MLQFKGMFTNQEGKEGSGNPEHMISGPWTSCESIDGFYTFRNSLASLAAVSLSFALAKDGLLLNLDWPASK